MLILTQNKSTVVNLDNITQIYCIRYDESNVDIACCFNRGGEILGRYSSIERCKEILQNILTEYQSMEEDKYYLMGNKSITTPKCTYIMPEE